MILIGMDYGRKKTGFAVYKKGLVLPQNAVFGSWRKIRGRLEELTEESDEFKVVLGLPLSASGKQTELSLEVKKFAEWLVESGYTVELVNEAGSSVAAMLLMSKKGRKGQLDSLAACEILKRYLKIT